ncbi:MAG: N(4)-(beta-N-acetylglucosaminyl)-L-asparaginase [Sediminibacterium sp.]|nr:N(4)-(beta-N-acetylglucosaminyl)-L-asparaginase [Sediminibacterium sp.]
MFTRRNFLKLTGVSSTFLPTLSFANFKSKNAPIVISTWDAGINANKAAWQILSNNGKALDAVEKGVMITENEKNCCVGLDANPDRDGFVTLDASIMDHQFNCGAVSCLERIKHPISVARLVMEKTPHVLLSGEGALQFAIQHGFSVEEKKLSDEAQKNYASWLKESNYKPTINIENSQKINAPQKLHNGNFNHDTISMLALDVNNNLAASCTTSGMAFKMRGRCGDGPIIGSGIYVDNEVGAAAATGQGEDCIRIAGSHTVVEFMRQGFSPEIACKKTIERIIKIKKDKAKDIQLAFIAIAANGDFGAFALQAGFSFAIQSKNIENKLIQAKHIL